MLKVIHQGTISRGWRKSPRLLIKESTEYISNSRLDLAQQHEVKPKWESKDIK